MLFEAFDLNSLKKWTYKHVYELTFMFDITAQLQRECTYASFYL